MARVAESAEMRPSTRKAAVRAILLEIWDPLSVGTIAQTRDEYDSYVPGLLRLIEAKADATDIQASLIALEIQICGAPADAKRSRQAAEALADIGRLA